MRVLIGLDGLRSPSKGWPATQQPKTENAFFGSFALDKRGRLLKYQHG